MTELKTTDKAKDSKVWATFCAAIKNGGHDSYFDELIEMEGRVAMNIKADYPIFLGLMITQDEAERDVGLLATELQKVRAQLAEAEKYDIRAIRARHTTLLIEIDEAQQKIATNRDEVTAIDILIETGV